MEDIVIDSLETARVYCEAKFHGQLLTINDEAEARFVACEQTAAFINFSIAYFYCKVILIVLTLQCVSLNFLTLFFLTAQVFDDFDQAAPKRYSMRLLDIQINGTLDGLVANTFMYKKVVTDDNPIYDMNGRCLIQINQVLAVLSSTSFYFVALTYKYRLF